jgi:hypothetical protein
LNLKKNFCLCSITVSVKFKKKIPHLPDARIYSYGLFHEIFGFSGKGKMYVSALGCFNPDCIEGDFHWLSFALSLRLVCVSIPSHLASFTLIRIGLSSFLHAAYIKQGEWGISVSDIGFTAYMTFS